MVQFNECERRGLSPAKGDCSESSSGDQTEVYLPALNDATSILTQREEIQAATPPEPDDETKDAEVAERSSITP